MSLNISSDKNLMIRPVEPDTEDCCNSGCDPCVFDVYRKQLELYEKYKKGQHLHIFEHEENLISETKYTSFQITFINEICEDHWILAFKHAGQCGNKILFFGPGQHFLMKFINSHSAFSKAYTPVCLEKYTAENDFLIIVKKYPEGVVSNFLCSRSIGEEILWRGPYGSYHYVANNYKRICMIAQGTGIAPFFSVINCILNNADDYTSIYLLYCTKNVKTILFRKELYSFTQFWNFNYKVFVSQHINESDLFYKEPIENKKLDKNVVIEIMLPLQNDTFLICGSTKFTNEYLGYIKKLGVSSDHIQTF